MGTIKLGNLILPISIQTIVVFLFFCTSLINPPMLLTSTAAVMLFLLSKNELSVGAVKTMIFIVTRTIINPGLAPGYGALGTFKWVIIFLLSGIMIVTSIFNGKLEYRIFIVLLFVFFSFLILDSLLFSGYPIISLFKAFAWWYVFFATIVAICRNREVNWVSYIIRYLDVLVLASPLAIFLDIAYLRNGHAFQGITNQPNMFGILSALTFALNIHLLQQNYRAFRVFMCFLSPVLCFLSESRTGMLCIAMCFITYIYFTTIVIWKKVVLTFVTVCVAVFLLSLGYGETFLSFIYKGRSIGDLLYSREGQISRAIEKYENNRWFGSGFMVPFNNGDQSFLLSFDLTVEPGNLILALLGDIGIVGTIFFSIIFGQLFFTMNKRNIILFLFPLVASMGEMMFFSTNNIAPIYYILYAVCLCDKKELRLE